VSLHILLLLTTFFTTTLVGTGLAQSFHANQPADLDQEISLFLSLWAHPGLLIDGLPFSLTLLTILMAHEMGHYIACIRYGIDASLPYFLPAPTLIGTFGAFIRIRSPIYTRRALFDVGAAGPLAGFAFLFPALTVGLLCSRVQPGIAAHGDFIFGNPLLLRLMERLVFPGIPASDVSLHPVARAAWVGMLATALNLLPIGQLDGGHIIYAFFRRRHKLLSRIFVVALAPLGYYYLGWLAWAVVLGLFGLRHPVIFDDTPIGPMRVWLGIFALLLLITCFTLVPIKIG
jgi:membrane-associated protease RseP (regulator of RpoE activity)